LTYTDSIAEYLKLHPTEEAFWAQKEVPEEILSLAVNLIKT